MKDQPRTNQELLEEISVLKQRIRELEQSESELSRMEEALIRERDRVKTLLDLYQLPESSIQDFAGYLVAECIKISKSQLGFFGFINEDETLMVAHLWSEKAMEDCAIDNKPVEFSLGHAGLWAEAIREHRPIIVNDYQKPDSRKKGYPEGHVQLSRLMSIPVIEGERAVAIVAVANKRQDYSESDILRTNLLIQSVWGIMQRKQAEETLKEREEQYRGLFEHMAEGCAYCRMIFENGEPKDFIYLEVNTAFETLTGLQNVIGKKVSEVIPGIREADPQLFAIYARVSLTGKPEKSEMFIEALKMWFSLSVFSLGKECFVAIFDIITERKRAEERLRNSLVELENSKTATLNLLDDLTKETEARLKLEERLHLTEKMESLGLLAGGVAHDMNNILGALSVYTELLLEKIPDGSSLKEYVENILLSNKKGTEIIQDMLLFSKSGMHEYRVININSMISGFFNSPVFQKLQNSYPDIVFRKELSPQLLNIKGSSVHLEKMVMNLLLNAAEAVSGNGEVEIRTENRLIETPVHGYDEITEGVYAVVTVSDTGIGISAADIRRIFEPFFTRKVMGRKRGTGLGLPIVWGTMKDHNGYIDVFSETGKGSSFTLYFPVTREEPAENNLKIPVENYMGRGELILVIDDVAEQRDIAKKMLTNLGYQIHVVSSGEEAVEYLKTHKADLLILDMLMEPGIDGLETYERILKINPKQRAIIASGFIKTERIMKALDLGAGSYIKKPYLIENIGVAIRDELQKEREGIFQNGKNSNH